MIKAFRKKYYNTNKSKVLASCHAHRLKNLRPILKYAHKYYAINRLKHCTDMRRCYELAEPKIHTQDLYIVELTKKILSNCRIVKS